MTGGLPILLAGEIGPKKMRHDLRELQEVQNAFIHA